MSMSICLKCRDILQLRHTQMPICRRWLSAVELSYDKYTGTSHGRFSTKNPLVILHGVFGQKKNWRSLAKQFQRVLNNVVFTVDLRNHGSSPWTSTMTYAEMAEDVRCFIDNLIPKELGDKTPVHLLGHSMGGKTAMHLAQFPDSEKRIASLIIEDVAPRKYEGRDGRRNFPLIVKTMLKADLSKTRHEIEEEVAEAVPNDTVTREFLMLNLHQSDDGTWKWKANFEVIGRQMAEICSEGVDSNRTFKNPCLFISGRRSTACMIGDRPLILQLFPEAEFIVIDDAAHWVHAENPHDFMDAVVNFLRKQKQ